jgi:CDP-4-dehydro-6-deoxyglucose reductase
MIFARTSGPPGVEGISAPGGALARGGEVSAEIVDLTWLNASVMRLLLELPAAIRFDYQPGQFLAVVPADGAPRCFSMAAPPSGRIVELHVRYRGGRGFSQWLKEKARIADRVAIAGPYGDFAWRSRGGGRVILLATGTGIAPISAMLEHALAHNDKRQGLRLYWGGRHTDDFYRAPMFRRWQETHGNFVFVPVLSRRGAAGAGFAVGRVQDVALAEASNLHNVDVYACGSPGMVEDARARFLQRADMSPSRFFSDSFEPAAVAEKSGPAAPTVAVIVKRRESADRIEARIGDTLLAALKRAGFPLFSICGGRASCGTCKTGIVPAWSARLPPPSQIERNLLACLPDSRVDDRLACQITLTAGLDGLEICPSG